MTPTARGPCARRAPTSLGPSPRAREVPPPAHVRSRRPTSSGVPAHAALATFARYDDQAPALGGRPCRPHRRSGGPAQPRGGGRRPPRIPVPSPWLRRQRSGAANPWSPFRATALRAPATVPPGRPWQRPRSTRSPPRGRAGGVLDQRAGCCLELGHRSPAQRHGPRAASGHTGPAPPSTKRRQPRRLAPPPTRLGTGKLWAHSRDAPRP